MTTIPVRQNDQSSHAAAIERWDNEGGASSPTSQQRNSSKFERACIVPASTLRTDVGSADSEFADSLPGRPLSTPGRRL